MSVLWHYSLCLGRSTISPSAVEHILAVCADLDFVPLLQANSGVGVISADGLESLSFASTSEALPYLSVKGGLLDLRHTRLDFDLSLSFLPSEASGRVGEPQHAATAGDDGDWISFSVEDLFYRRRDLRLPQLAQDLFLRIATRERAEYGVLLNEALIDAAMPALDLHSLISIEGRPRMLGWLNLLRRPEAHHVDPAELARLGASLTRTPAGLLASFGHVPWDATEQEMLAINTAWKAAAPHAD